MPRGRRYVLIAIAMAFVCMTGNISPSQAAPQGDAAATSAKPLALGKFTKHRKKHVRHARPSRKHHVSAKTSAGPDKDDKTKASTEAKANEAKSNKTKSDKRADKIEIDQALPPSVANARAELTSPASEPVVTAQNTTPESSTLTEADKAASVDPTPSGVQITTSDQLNDLDREAAAPPEPTTVALAQIASPLAASANEDHASHPASLIGKIFIAFGVMLTLASAVRMLWPQRAT